MSTDTGQKVVLSYPAVLNSFDANEPVCVIEKGPETTTVRSWACSSFTDASIQFPMISPPSKSSSIRREIVVRYILQVCCKSIRAAQTAAGPPTVFAASYPRTLLITKGTAPILNNTNIRGKWPSMTTNASGFVFGHTATDGAFTVSQSGGIPCAGGTTPAMLADLTSGYGPVAGGVAGVADSFFPQNAWDYSQSAMGLCLRPFPLQTCCSNVALAINSATTTFNPSRLTSIISKKIKRETILDYSSTCPMLPDSTALYGLRPKGEDPFNAFSSVDSEYTRHISTSRFRSVAGGGGADLSYSFYIAIDEPLLVSPCKFGDTNDSLGFVNVNTLQLTLTLQNLQAAVSAYYGGVNDRVVEVHIAPNEAYGLKPEGWYQPTLVITTSEPDPMIASKIPAQVNYYHEYINSFTTQVQTTFDVVPPINTQVGVNTTNVALTNIPEIIILSVQPTLGALQAPCPGGIKMPYVPNVFLPIERISIQFGARVGLLSTCTSLDLWKISKRNGYTGSYEDWRYGSGGFLIINVSQDLGLPTSEISGQLGSVPFQADIVCSTSNVTQADYSENGILVRNALFPTTWEAMVTTIHPGQFIIGQGNAYVVPVSVSKETVTSLVAKLGDKTLVPQGAPSAVSLTSGDKEVAGGGFGSMFTKLVSKGLHHGLGFLADNPNLIKGGVGFLQKKLGSMGGDGGDLVGAGMGDAKRSRFE